MSPEYFIHSIEYVNLPKDICKEEILRKVVTISKESCKCI